MNSTSKKRTFQAALETLLLCKKIRESDREFILTKQLIRSATSVRANIRESRNAQSKKDFIHKESVELMRILSSILLKSKANLNMKKGA
nr:four helix bundle protein [Fluviicola sp.]